MSLSAAFSAVLSAIVVAVSASAQSATLIELPMLPPPAGWSVSPHVAGINATGDVAGTVYFTYRACTHCPSQSITRSFLVSNGGVAQIGPDGFSITAINDSGQIVGNLRNPVDGLTYPYLYEAGILTPLSATPGSVQDINNLGEVTYLPGMNDWGIVTAMMSDGEHGTHAFKYRGAFPTNDLTCAVTNDYECMTGYTTGFDFVADINNGSTVAEAMAVGGDRNNPWSSSYGRQQAFVGYRGQTTYLSAGFTAAALSVNDNGVVVGFDDGKAIAWLPRIPGTWSERSIDSLANDPSWVCREADAVNNSGLVAGTGLHDGVSAVFLATLDRQRLGPGHQAPSHLARH